MLRKPITLFSAFFIAFSSLSQGLVINEVVSKNTISYTSPLNENPDWIELYNASNSTIALNGYFLSDDPQNKTKWSFTNGSIEPQKFLLIEASGENRNFATLDTLTTSDLTTLGYNYSDMTDPIPGTSEIRYTIFPNSTTGIIDTKPVVGAQIYIANPPMGRTYSYAGVYIKFDTWETTIDRSEFDVLRVKMYLEKDRKVTLRMSQDGLENRFNYGVTVTGRGDTSWYELPFKGVDTGLLDLSVLSGFQIEGDQDFDSTTDFIVFDLQFQRIDFANFSTNFKLSSSGETLNLFNPDTSLADVIEIPELLQDYSFGRETDGAADWVIFSTPTPNASNGGTTTTGFCDKKLVFSENAGFYPGNVELNISGANEIRYTLDGSNPTNTSPVFNSTLILDTSTVIRAACYDNNATPKQIFTNTYFVGYDSKIPVWSLSTHPGNFFDADTGIYVFGPDASPADPSPYFNANFWKDWERPVHAEFFETDGTRAFGVDCGVKIFGNFSKANPKKSLSLEFKKIYGPARLEYPLFPDYPEITSFNDLILRSSGGDANILDFRDGFNQTLIKDADFETQKYRASVVFINGEYWGIHNTRERSNPGYFLENFGIEDEDIDMASAFSDYKADGNISQYLNFIDSLRQDLYSYEEINEIMDISSFIDFFSYEIYIANYDWPANNLKAWRQRATNGKWRWFMYDTDLSTSIYNDNDDSTPWDTIAQVNFNAFRKATTFIPGTDWPNSEVSTLFLRKFLQIPEFKTQFVNRYCDLMNTTLIPSHVLSLLQTEVLDRLDEEIPRSRERWEADLGYYESQLTSFKDFWQRRPAFARSNMQQEINLGDQKELTLQISPSGAGYIKLNTIEVDEDEWTGIYFEGIPVSIEAVANPGFEFNSWSTTSLDADLNKRQLTNILLNRDEEFRAIFTGSPVDQKITISEINYNSPSELNTQDWVELHNFGNEEVDLSGWKLKDSKIYNEFIIPEGTILNAGEYLVLTQDNTAFSSIYSGTTVDEPLGPFNFSLNNTGERIKLLDNRDNVVLDIMYDDNETTGWSTFADGQGGTLELENQESLATSISSDWISTCFGGSPSFKYDTNCPDILSLEDLTVGNVLYSLSPNPTSDFINIPGELLGDIDQLELFAIDGRYISELEPSSRVSVSSLEQGMYLIKVSTDNNEQISLKFIKE